MSPPAQHYSHDSHSYDASAYRDAYEDSDLDEVYVPAGPAPLMAGDRIGVPLKPKRGRRLVRWSIFALVCVGGVWALRDDTGTVAGLITQFKSAATPVVERLATALAPPPAPVPVASAPPAPEPPPLPAPADVAPASIPATSIAIASPPAGASGDAPAEPEASAPARPEPLPPPVVDEANPYQKRAAAIGLHPGISPAVLERLSATDYRNGGTAIEKALKETPDGEIFVWPKPAGAGAALFQIRFVQGSNAACRRYLVNVTKDGWSTTAPAMEKCGIRTPGAKSAKTATE